MEKNTDKNYSLAIEILAELIKASIKRKAGKKDETKQGGNLRQSVNSRTS